MLDLSGIEPLHLAGLADYHCHCDYSIDAVGTIEEYCQAALKRGLAEICFTTHFDSNPNSQGDPDYIRIDGVDKPATVDNLAPYVEDTRKAHESHYPRGLSVKLGIEFGWFPGCEERVAEVRNHYDFDYFLCGIHEIDNICFCTHKRFEACFSQWSVEKLVDKYTSQVVEAASSGLFDTTCLSVESRIWTT